MIYRIVIFIFKVFFTIFYRYKIEYLCDPKELPKGVIIAPNHASYLDPPLVSASWCHALHFFAGHHLFKKPILGFLLPLLNCHPVVRGKERVTIRQAVDLLKQGQDVVVFPEGTRSKHGELLSLKTGVAYISLMTGNAIVPCYVEGTHEVWPKGKKFPKLFHRQLLCRFGAPLFPDTMQENKDQLTHRLEKALHELSRAS